MPASGGATPMPSLVIERTTILYRIRHSARARRLRLTVGPAGVEVTAPPRTSERTIAGFVTEHQGWIRAKLGRLEALMAAHPGSARLADGALIPLHGERVRLAVRLTEGHRAKVVEADGLRVDLPLRLAGADPDAALELLLTRWLRQAARADAEAAIARYGAPHGLVPSGLVIKAQKRLWGSCTARGVINLNWRLVLAPPAVLDYVVVHELCHLRHRHHQPAFWQLVGEVMPDYARHRRWLRAEGMLLTLRPAF
jgi:hypothetical protein